MHISLLRPRTACTRTYVTVVITYTEARSFRQINSPLGIISASRVLLYDIVRHYTIFGDIWRSCAKLFVQCRHRILTRHNCDILPYRLSRTKSWPVVSMITWYKGFGPVAYIMRRRRNKFGHRSFV